MLISSALTDDLPFGFLHFLVIGSYFTVHHPLTRLYMLPGLSCGGWKKGFGTHTSLHSLYIDIIFNY